MKFKIKSTLFSACLIMANVNSNAQIIVVNPNTTCIPTNVTGDLQPQRLTITNSTGVNKLDLRVNGTVANIEFNQNVVSTTTFPPPPNTILKINSSCGGDVEIAKGGGFLSIGNFFELGNPTRNSNILSNLSLSYGSKIGQRITTNHQVLPANYPSPPILYNTQLFVNQNKTRALSVFNTLTNVGGEETFIVYGDGRLEMNIKNSASNPDALSIKDLATNTINFKVKSTGVIYARELQIATGTFPDYVFEKTYNRLTLSEIKKYIEINKHLPGFESAEYYINNGIATSTMFVKQQEKIEELTLYSIELEERLRLLENKLQALDTIIKK